MSQSADRNADLGLRCLSSGYNASTLALRDNGVERNPVSNKLELARYVFFIQFQFIVASAPDSASPDSAPAAPASAATYDSTTDALQIVPVSSRIFRNACTTFAALDGARRIWFVRACRIIFGWKRRHRGCRKWGLGRPVARNV